MKTCSIVGGYVYCVSWVTITANSKVLKPIFARRARHRKLQTSPKWRLPTLLQFSPTFWRSPYSIKISSMLILCRPQRFERSSGKALLQLGKIAYWPASKASFLSKQHQRQAMLPSCRLQQSSLWEGTRQGWLGGFAQRSCTWTRYTSSELGRGSGLHKVATDHHRRVG